MGHKFAEIAFTKAVKEIQVEQNSRSGYARMEQGQDVNYLLSQHEADFIASRDSFYMASVSETNWPYMQHRGGPVGFLKVVDEKTIGFADYSGNRQYISTGNFKNNDRVSLFLMDYPSQTRLKILGRVTINDESKAISQLEDASFRAPVERGFTIHIEAFDWNCPKYITPRFTERQIQSIIEPIKKENDLLKKKLALQVTATVNDKADVFGEGPLKLVISGIRQLALNVRAFELKDPNGMELPEVSAGSHIQVPVRIANGKMELRHYSICSNTLRRDIYEIAVLSEPNGKGGSKAIYQQYQLGQIIACQLPENHFHLQAKKHKNGAKAVLIAGGIGITPIKAMAQSLHSQCIPFQMHYAGKSINAMAFSDRLKREYGNYLTLYSSSEDQRINIARILIDAGEEDIFYLCGPNSLIDEFTNEARKLNVDPERLRFERFNASIDVEAKPINLTLKQSGKTIHVGAQQTILDAMIAADINPLYSCKTGECRACAVKVLTGEPHHLDNALSMKEHEQQLMCPCVSRAKTSHLTLDI